MNRARSSKGSTRTAAARVEAPNYDRDLAERYWGEERMRIGDPMRIVLSAGEPPYVNDAYHRWETESILRATGSLRGRRVLDIACGLGRVSRVLAAKGARLSAVDNAQAMLQTARQALRKDRARAQASWAQAISSALPYPDRSFDLVVCLGLLEHLPRALQLATLAESLRVLVPGGSLFLVLNNNRSLLLQSGEDNRYRRDEQLANGYYCGLVDRVQLGQDLERHGARVKTLGSNAHYSLLRHGLRGKTHDARQAKEAARAFAEATDRDLLSPHQGWLGEACADHFLYRVVKSRVVQSRVTKSRVTKSRVARVTKSRVTKGRR